MKNPTTRRPLHVRHGRPAVISPGVWPRIILATTLAACIGLAHTALGQLSEMGELTETMMQAQAYDAIFLATMDPDPLTSPLSVTYSIRLSADSFSFSLNPGQTIDGMPVSDSGAGSGKFNSGLYDWTSSMTVGDDTASTAYSATWDPDKAAINGTISISDTARWLVTGSADVWLSPSLNQNEDSSEVTMQKQIKTNGKWVTQYSQDATGFSWQSTNGDWKMSFFVKGVDQWAEEGGSVGSYSSTWHTLPEPGSFDLLWTGATWAGVAGAASMLRVRRSCIGSLTRSRIISLNNVQTLRLNKEPHYKLR